MACFGYMRRYSLYRYADEKTPTKKAALGLPHAFIHLALIVGLTSIIAPLNAFLFGFAPASALAFWLTVIEFLVGGFAGGLVWGAYLSHVCGKEGQHYNDAFSAMRLDSFRHFLRMRIRNDELLVYPIGIDAAPARKDWTVNPKAAKNNQVEPVYMPSKPLGEHLIEGPVVIRAPLVQSVEEVAKT